MTGERSRHRRRVRSEAVCRPTGMRSVYSIVDRITSTVCNDNYLSEATNRGSTSGLRLILNFATQKEIGTLSKMSTELSVDGTDRSKGISRTSLCLAGDTLRPRHHQIVPYRIQRRGHGG